jgi:hypothetical protein
MPLAPCPRCDYCHDLPTRREGAWITCPNCSRRHIVSFTPCEPPPPPLPMGEPEEIGEEEPWVDDEDFDPPPPLPKPDPVVLTPVDARSRAANYLKELRGYAGDNHRATNAGDLSGRLGSLDSFVLCLQRLKTLHAVAPGAFTPELLGEIGQVNQEVRRRNKDLAAFSSVACRGCASSYDRWRVDRCFHCLNPICPSCYVCGCPSSRPLSTGQDLPEAEPEPFPGYCRDRSWPRG